MTAEAFEVRPPQVEAVRWDPADFATVSNALAWLEFSGADPVIVAEQGGQQRLTAGTVLTIRPDPWRVGRCHVRPGEWVIRDQRYGGRFIVRNQQQFTTEYRRQQQ